MPVIDCDPERARDRLESEGVDVRVGNTEHELWRAERDGATAVAYDDSVVVQGSDPARLAGLSRMGAGAHTSTSTARRAATPGRPPSAG